MCSVVPCSFYPAGKHRAPQCAGPPLLRHRPHPRCNTPYQAGGGWASPEPAGASEPPGRERRAGRGGDGPRRGAGRRTWTSRPPGRRGRRVAGGQLRRRRRGLWPAFASAAGARDTGDGAVSLAGGIVAMRGAGDGRRTGSPVEAGRPDSDPRGRPEGACRRSATGAHWRSPAPRNSRQGECA